MIQGWLTDWRIRTSFKTDVELHRFKTHHVKKEGFQIKIYLIPPLNVVAVVFLQIILIATLIGRFQLPKKHLYRRTKGSKIPMQIRDPEAQPHLPTGSLAKNLAHLTYSFQNCVSNSIMATQHYHHSRVFLPNKQVTGAWFFFCLKGKHFFLPYTWMSARKERHQRRARWT